MMMGVPKAEVDQVLQNAKADMRIAGFDEEEKRLKQRTLSGPSTTLKLPQGNYIFSEFRTLSIPGLEVTFIKYIILLCIGLSCSFSILCLVTNAMYKHI